LGAQAAEAISKMIEKSSAQILEEAKEKLKGKSTKYLLLIFRIFNSSQLQ